jgi:hypothetical protein
MPICARNGTAALKLLDQIEQAQLSATARSKLGSYSQQDYENWHLKANRGQLVTIQ